MVIEIIEGFVLYWIPQLHELSSEAFIMNVKGGSCCEKAIRIIAVF